MRNTYYLIAVLLLAAVSSPGQNVVLHSPDGRLTFHFGLVTSQPSYSVDFKGKEMIGPSRLNLVFDDGDLTSVTAGPPEFKEGREQYDLVVGKTSHVDEAYRQVSIALRQVAGKRHTIKLTVRIFNDGVAFRYEFPSQKGWSTFNLNDEVTRFHLQGNPKVTALFLPGYTSSHEGLYHTVSYADIRQDTLMDLPPLFEFPGIGFMSITEARLQDYAGMYLIKHGNELISKLSPYPGKGILKVHSDVPHVSPWRVILISDRPGALIESNIVTNLNDPCAIRDTGWIKPGKATWPWWNGNVVPDTLNAPGMNFVTNQYYIDFCARSSIEYHSVVEYGLHQWYTDDGVSFMPGPHSDVTKPVPGLNMKEICDYAAKKGVGIRVWVHWAALYPKLDSALTLMEQWGVKGMMVDFMDRDDQEMVNIQNEILRKSAFHHIHVQFHGAYKPTGLSRTWPNEFTREGALNYETDKWNPKGLPPDHDINIPFTRMLAGPVDYHLGGFRAVHQDQYRMKYTRPNVLGTRAHMLAMYVVLESYLQLVCDYPEAYEGQTGFDFIQSVPTTWDETRVIDAKVNGYVIIARRKADRWYVGAITNHETRSIQLPLSFLGDGTYSAQVYADSKADDPNRVELSVQSVSREVILKIDLNSGGGVAVVFRKK